MFKVFDKENKKYLGLKDFAEGMITLFTESYEKLIKFIFNFYDFEKCGKITIEDIRVVLSYIPLSISSKNSSKIVKYEIKINIGLISTIVLNHKMKFSLYWRSAFKMNLF